MHIDNTTFVNLLFKHKSISLSAIGVFSVEILPAAVERMGRDFSPPQYRIAFNRPDRSENQLHLIIASEYGFTHEEALRLSDGFVESILVGLNEGETYLFNGFGTLRKTDTGNILFEAFDSGALAFGLPEFSTDMISRQQAEIQIERPARKKRRVPVLLVLLLFLITAGATAWFVFPEQVRPLWGKVILLFDSTSESKNAEVSTDTLKNTVDSNSVVVIDTMIADTTDVDTSKSNGIAVANASFFVIGGSFVTQSEADEFCNKLKQRGFPAEIVQSPAEGRIRVAYKSFTAKPDALDYLNRIRVSENKPDIWLYTKK
ncbi:MAG: hypothetical protein CVU11_05625 [Bacteroidetes bacterium HGW-Bacteroidetes-6]|jgi:hypothetical protein|nr:MAG: hypothetical protein CVU11_05625 [Bacteroidetes bacterium HGW-Bacteroidetes-6]